MTERKIGWYNCIDMEAYLDNNSINKGLVNAFFEDGRVLVGAITGGTGFVNADTILPIISEGEWGFFEKCNSKGYYPNYKKLFEELLEVTESSDGVTGLHLNVDIATWDELENNNWLPLLKEWKEKQHA